MGKRSNVVRPVARAGKPFTLSYSRIQPEGLSSQVLRASLADSDVGPTNTGLDATHDLESLLTDKVRNRDDNWSGPVPNLTSFDYYYPFLASAQADDACSVDSGLGGDENEEATESVTSDMSYSDTQASDDDEYEEYAAVSVPRVCYMPRKRAINALLPVPQKIYGSLVEEEYVDESD